MDTWNPLSSLNITLDPPVLTSSASMEGKKMAPPPHQHPPRPHQPHPPSNHAENHYTDSPQYTQAMQQPHYNQPNTVIHQPPTRPQQQQSIGPRSPLLENHQDLYGTRQPTELARQYALREQQMATHQRIEHQQRSAPMHNSLYSPQSPSQDPILTAPVPPGYNASVHQAYLRRNQHQLGDHQQIYQNHQSIYQPANQQQRIYQPYTSRIQQPNYMTSGHSHTQLLRQQYNELQQMKLQTQMQYQSQAQIQQQQTFAQRQILHQHLHSRQQSQQNLSQYGTSPSTAQLNEVNARLTKKQDNMITPDDYANHPSNKGMQNQTKQSSVSPVSKTSGPLSDPLSSPSTKSPSGSESRRSSSGTSQALRSPIAQRPTSSPVTRAGWLYKQGSDGLKVWRKRWFVLSEYCLFYYKGQEEDKLLGSVLLPSYVVSTCSGDEKGLRKWSFKCEHANMRTYILAAPDQNSMEQWVRVLTMAATMQDGSLMEKVHHPSGNQPSHNKERRSKTPINSAQQDDNLPETSGGVQHMYENAPPKPRRSNEGYQSPSPERVDRYDPNYDILREPSAYSSADSAPPKPMKSRMSSKSPVHTNAEAIYESKSASSNYATQKNLTKSPEAIYNAHNLSLPLTNTNNRLENNKSPSNFPNNTSSRVMHNNENRMSQNKSPAYFNSKNETQDNLAPQSYHADSQNIYVESGYQKMLQQQEMNKRMMEREQYNQEQGAMQRHQHNMNRTGTNGPPVERQSFERRTPDTYGRSMVVPGYYSKGRSGDYEDVYNNPSHSQNYGEQSYRRPMSPVAYEEKNVTPVQLPHQRYAQTNLDTNQIYQAPPVQMRQKKLPHNAPVNNNIPRPHSADFLEYEAKNPSYDPNVPARHANPTSRQPPRPKSSLDINTHNDYNGDNYYYSEASYAEKMRQSAHYLRNKNFGSTVFNPRQSDPKSPEYVKERKMSMPSFRGDEGNIGNYDAEMRIDRESIYGARDQNRNVNGSDKYGHSEVTGPNSNWTLRNKSLSQIMTQDDVYNRSNSAMSEGSTVSGFNRESQMTHGSGDQFMRSASARLPSTGSDQLSSRDGERKVQQVGVREESMKRLLEWKQRMLQSPLTRKPTPATLSLARSLPPGPSQRQTLPKVSTRLHNQIQPSYNSYSSDDEERLGEVVGAAGDTASQPEQGQAGRSITPSPPSSPLPSPPLELQPRSQPAESFSNSDSRMPDLGNLHSRHRLDESPSSITAPSLSTVIDIPQTPQDSDAESEMQLEYTDNDLDEILAQSDENEDTQDDSTSGRKSVMRCFPKGNDRELTSNFERESISQRFPDYEICEINDGITNSNLKDCDINNVKIRSKASTPKPETPPNEEEFEDHYLPMSPRKAVLDTEPAHTEIIKNISVFGSVQHHEDNPYVEMSQGIGVESAFLNEEMQAYEVVCVSSGKVEPVYMELNHLPDKNVLDDKSSNSAFTDTSTTSKYHKSNAKNNVPPPKSILRKQISESKLSVKSASRMDVKSPLPDILMNSQGKNNSSKSDGSEADDEGSKDFPIGAAFSRFSISDSFRPASYYLGSSGILSEAQDSSDSELVSPPPIPTSPPPMEELDMSLAHSSQKTKWEDNTDGNDESGRKISSEKKSTLMVYGNTPSMYDTIFKGERIKRNRASMPDNDRKSKEAKNAEANKRSSLDSKFILPTYRTSGNTDTDSLLSYNADRGSSRMSLESDFSSKFDMSVSSSAAAILGERQNENLLSEKNSIHDGEEEFVELRHVHHPTDNEIERMLKRRPLSEESCIEIESLDSNFNENIEDVNLDQYLDELQSSDVYLYANTMYPGMKSSSSYFQDSRSLDMATVGYLNDRVAAIREEVQYENIQLIEKGMERSRSRNSIMSNTISDPDTINTVRPMSGMSNTSGVSGSVSSLHVKSSLSVRSASRNSLPTESNLITSPYNPINHTRHASYEQPTISYYSKNTSYFENDASILKNLNQSLPHDRSNKVNISEMNKAKSTKTPESIISQNVQPKASQPAISHSRDSSLEQSAPYYYSDLSSQDNLNVTASAAAPYPPSFNKNNFTFNSKLNNQRRKGPLGKKCDISHIYNPIHSNSNYNQLMEPGEGPIQIAAAARCVSVEFLSAADKFTDIDNKNIYESDTLKKKKVRDSMPSLHSSLSSKNIYLSSNDKSNSTDVNMTLFGQHFEESRNKSLERILNQTVTSGNNNDTRPRSDMSRSRSQSALSEVIDSQNQPSVSNRLTEFPVQNSSPNAEFHRKPINNNLYTEVGSGASNSENCRAGDMGDVRIEDGNTCDGEMMWDEDSLWTENLRRVSQRHARSLDHLDCLVSPTGTSGRRSVDLKTMLKSSDGTLDSESKSRSGRLSREVKYVNDNVKSQRPLSSKRRPYKKNPKKPLLKLVMIDQSNENDVYVQLASESVKAETIENVDDGVYEQLATDSQKVAKESQPDVKESEACEVESKGCEVRKRFEIDREKLRQWDLMSSGEGCGGEGEVASTTPATTASMSASITGVENSIGKRQPLVGGGSSNRGAQIPVRAVSPRVRPSADQIGWSGNDDSLWASQIVSQTMNTEEGWSTSRSPSRQSTNQPIRAVSPRVRRASDVDERPPPIPLSQPPESPTGLQTLPGAVPDLSAGELLGRTHEELVLLLIQLRRRQSATASAIEQCCTQIHSVQTRLSTDETSEHRHENLQRLEQLRRHLSDLERHYTKSKPLVHLVDNMVKLGALYNRGPTTLDRLEQSQLFRERALLEQAQEQRRWAESSESLSREQVEQRVEQLRAMERSVAGEAQTLRGLRREREALQRALGGAHLQQDLSRVHAMLAINSKKLEQTVAGNARLEQELSVLRQKLQGQHLHQLSKGDLMASNDGADARTAADTTALLEDELKRVQHLVGDLQKQRQELSIAVRQLTDKSQSLGLVSSNSNIHAASQNDFSNDPSNSQANKKRFNPHWVETDLDDEAPEHGSCSPTGRSMAPLYIDIHSTEQRASSPDQNDDLGLNSAFANLSSVEKQEIKTVRIVKRESERRQRDRERSSLQPGNSEWSAHQAVGTLDQLLEEDSMAQYSSRSTSLPRGFQPSQPQYTYNPNTSYQQDSQPNPRQYLYPKDNTPVYQHRSQHANPPNTLSLTNVNNPFDNMSISSASINNMFVSSPSLINNNDYTNNHQDTMQMSHSKYGYQKSAQILPLPVTSNNYSLTKHSMSHSVPYNMESSTADMGRSSHHYTNGPISPSMSKTASITSLTKGNAELSPVFTSEAARQIIIEMAGEKNGVVKSNGSQHRRQVPKEKRRHYTAPHHLSAKGLDQSNGDDFFYQEKWYRARDDVDMERVLRGGAKSSRGPPPLAAPPDVVRSTLPAPHTDHYSEHTIDRLLAAPNKILIPERYIPEQAPELSPEEQKKRMEKVESIKKMLSSTTPSGDPNKSPDDNDKRQREHLLQLNQILAKQVMEMSKIVAVKALQTQPVEGESSYDSEDLSPEVELPLYQQRDNFFT